LLTMTTPFALLLVIFSKQILGMFGAEYIEGRTVFYIVVFGQYIHTLCNFSVFALQAYRYRKFLIYCQLFFLVLVIVLTLVFISLWGILGAALGYTVPVVIMCIYLYLTVYFKLGLRIL
jgi:O-antigen/teichoic acid export membrane protein